MPDKLIAESCYYYFHIISISTIDYRIFLRSQKPEEKMLAILGDFGKDSPQTVLTKVAIEILQDAKGDLLKEKRKNQLRILAQLRNLVAENIEIMEPVSSFFKKERDIFYIVGQRMGMEKSKSKFVKNLLSATDFSNEKIATITGVNETFIQKLRVGIKQ